MSSEGPTDEGLGDLLAPFDPQVRQLTLDLRALVHRTVPDAIEEIDRGGPLIGFTYQPGTYKGLFAALAPQRAHVNLMFSKGVELQEIDEASLLEGTGKRARHIKIRTSEQIADPGVAALLEEAAKRTPR